MPTIEGVKPFGAKRGKQVRYIYSRVTAEVFDEKGRITTLDTKGSPLTRDGSDIVSMDTWKTIDQPMGTYSLTLVPRQMNYFREISVGNWCEIMGDNGDGLGLRPIVYGPIITINEQRTVGRRGEPKTQVVLRGADFGRAFAMTTAIYDAKLADILIDIGYGKLVAELKETLGTAGKIVKALITRFQLPELRQWIDPKTGKTFGVDTLDLKYIDETTEGEAIIEPFKMTGTLWATIQQWANISINELFIDYRVPFGKDDLVELVPAVVLRRFPFHGSDWNNLTNVKMTRDEVTNSTWTKSDADVKNWIRSTDEPRITGVRDGIITYANGLGTINKLSVEKFGFKRHEMMTPFLFEPKVKPPKSINDIMEIFSGYQSLWHHSNEELISGTMSTYFHPSVRVGYRLDFADTAMGEDYQFYIQAVGHRFMYPGASSTTLHVSRGRDVKNKRFTASLAELESDGVLEQLGGTIDRAKGLLKT